MYRYADPQVVQHTGFHSEHELLSVPTASDRDDNSRDITQLPLKAKRPWTGFLIDILLFLVTTLFIGAFYSGLWT